jgi:hypothetical protein
MATTPRIEDIGPLALGAARVNIFARPQGGEGQHGASTSRGVFDAAAACAGVPAPVAGSWSQSRRRRAVPARWGALLVPLISVAALVSALAAQPRDQGAVDRASPRLQPPSKPRASDRSKRRPPAAVQPRRVGRHASAPSPIERHDVGVRPAADRRRRIQPRSRSRRARRRSARCAAAPRRGTLRRAAPRRLDRFRRRCQLIRRPSSCERRSPDGS